MTTTQPTTGPRSSPPRTPATTMRAAPGTSPSTCGPRPSPSPAAPDDVVALVRRAREDGLRVAVQGTGHLAASLPDLTDALLVKTAIEPKVVVDAERRTVRVGAGALWGEVDRSAAGRTGSPRSRARPMTSA